MATNGTGILFLDRNGFLVYSSVLDRVLQFNFPPTVIRDMEIISSEMLESQLTAFFQQSGIEPFQGVILLSSNLLFEKPISPEQTEQEKNELNLFIENLPFENVGSITYTVSEPRYIATNKDFYQVIIKILQKMHCVIDSVVPAFLVDTDGTQFVSLSKQDANSILRSAQSVKQFSFLISVPPKLTPAQSTVKDIPRPPSSDQIPSMPVQSQKEEGGKRVFVLVGVFVVLLVVLGVVAYTML